MMTDKQTKPTCDKCGSQNVAPEKKSFLGFERWKCTECKHVSTGGLTTGHRIASIIFLALFASVPFTDKDALPAALLALPFLYALLRDLYLVSARRGAPSPYPPIFIGIVAAALFASAWTFNYKPEWLHSDAARDTKKMVRVCTAFSIGAVLPMDCSSETYSSKKTISELYRDGWQYAGDVGGGDKFILIFEKPFASSN